tara:strand:- start:17 stop:283 length:267 start_codon:yes stop_codon:yes gene_type:complete
VHGHQPELPKVPGFCAGLFPERKGEIMNEFLTTQETAKLLNLDTMTLWRWRKEGMGPPYFKLTDSIKRPVIRYPADELQKWLSARKTA